MPCTEPLKRLVMADVRTLEMDAVFKPLNDAALDTILGNGTREISDSG